MTDNPEEAQAGIADALQELSENSRVLVRHEIDAAQREMWAKAKDSAPAFGLVGAAGFLGLFAAAAAYRLSVEMLEKLVPPAPAALIAAAVYGGGAAYTSVLAVRRLHELPSLLPARTARHGRETVADTATQASSDLPLSTAQLLFNRSFS
jgi:hypothetical protein